jgi:predicted HicB family RNase H-like nuclease
MTETIIEIDGYTAVVSFDPEIGLFRGEFVGLRGGADFYAAHKLTLVEEGRLSLWVYLTACAEDGIDP